MDAWIDSMADLDAPQGGLTSVRCEPSGTVTLVLDQADFLPQEIYDSINDCAAFINWNRAENLKPPLLAIAAHRTALPPCATPSPAQRQGVKQEDSAINRTSATSLHNPTPPSLAPQSPKTTCESSSPEPAEPSAASSSPNSNPAATPSEQSRAGRGRALPAPHPRTPHDRRPQARAWRGLRRHRRRRFHHRRIGQPIAPCRPQTLHAGRRPGEHRAAGRSQASGGGRA